MAFSLKGQRVLAIDWDRRTVRFVLVRPRAEGVDLLKAASMPIPPEIRTEDATTFGAFLREAMIRTGVSAKRILLSIPREHVVLNTLNLPPTPAEELPSLVQFQIQKELPFAAEQATLDFAVSGEFDPKSPSSVLVAAVRNEELNYYRQVAEQAGLSIERIGLRPLANQIAVMAKSPELDSKTLLLVEVGQHLTEIDVIRGGQMVFSRAASVILPDRGEGGETMTHDSRITSTTSLDRPEDEETGHAVSQLMVEIIRSVEAHRAADPTISLDQIIVCGSTGLEARVAQLLGARFATVSSLYTPDRAMGLSVDRARSLQGFNAAIGLAIGHGRKGLSFIDFLHPKKPVSRHSVRMKKIPLVAASAVLFIGAGLTFHFKFIYPKTQEVKRLEAQRAKLRKLEEPIVRFKSQVEGIEAWLESERQWPMVLTKLTEVFPPESEGYVTRLDLEMLANPKSTSRDAAMRVRFRTASLGSVNALAAKLRDAGFEQVIPGKETPSEVSRDGYKYETNIDARVPVFKMEAVVEPEPSGNTDGDTEKSTSEAGGAPGATGQETVR